MEPSTGTGSDLRSDAELIVASRAGDAGAFGALYERHAGAALVVARQYISGAAEAEDVVADAFAAVWTALRGGSGPTDAFRAYLFTVVRRVAAVHREKGRRTEPTDDVAVFESGGLAEPGAEEPALAGFERSVVARAFAGLPERWQAVLWHSEVEGLTPAEIAPLLGLSANSTAALAYRAREGLRQAYLQHHLHEPLDDACRAIAGKLGGYVRDGLGQRDTAQVEAHLEGCGTCRGLVLELRDVNHGLRAIVAPLVLGVVGLGALQYGLPTSGGLAAGSASLASGGATGGAAGAGATAGAGAAGAGAGAGTGAVAAAGVGAAGAVGTGMAAGAAGVSGGAAAGGLFAAITGVLAGVPTAVVAAVAGVVVVGGVAFGVTQLGRGGDEGAAPGPSASASPSDGPALGNDLAGTSGPGGASTAGDETPGDGSSSAADDERTGDSAGSGAPRSGSGTGSGQAGSGAGQPTAPATPTSRPARLEIGVPEGTLVAGSAGQTLAIDVANTGDEPATNVYAVVGLPDHVSAPSQAGRLSGRFAVVSAVTTWACVPSGGDVRCSLPVLGGGERARLELTVEVDEAFDADEGDVSWEVGADEPVVPVSRAARVPVTPAPARLTLIEPTGTPTLLRGRETGVILTLKNAGAVAGAARVDIAVPDGLSAANASDDWACEAGPGNDLSCRTDAVAPRASRALGLWLRADENATDGALDLTLTPAGTQPTASARFGYQVLTPARLAASASASELPLALGQVTTTTVTVTNSGGLDARGVTATLAAPVGAAWAAGQPGGCAGGATPAELVCGLGALAPGASAPLTVALEPLAPTGDDPGSLVVRVEADHADPGELAVPATVVLPALDLGLTVSESGTVSATVGVDVADAADLGVTVTLPTGLSFDRAAATWPQACVLDPTGLVATCSFGRVERGEQVGTALPATVQAAISGVVHGTVTAAGPASASATAAVGTTSSGLAVRYQARGAYDVVEVGAPVLGCAEPSSCQSSNNNNVDMVPIDAAAPDGERPTVPVSSSTALTLPAGARVTFAGLYWSANVGPGDTWSAPLSTARLRGPGGGYQDIVAASAPTTVPDNAGRTYYQSFADVTELVAQRGAGTWSVADVAVSATRNDGNRTYYGGWALVVVFEVPAAANATVTVYDGAAWVGTDGPGPEFRFVTEPGAAARAGVVAWEGDRATTGDQLLLDGTALVPLRAGGAVGSSGNAFDSTATGWAYANSLGVDAKGFRPATTKGSVGVLRATTTGDQYLLGAVTVRLTA